LYVKSLDLKNYRNFEKLSLLPDPGINIIYGGNAQGKTNILEAIYLGGTTKSHRGTKDRDIIRMGEEESHLRMHIIKADNDYRIDMHLKKNKPKGIAIGGIPIRRAGELFGIVNMVFFSPEDLSIIKNGPSERRKFMDLILCELDRIYLSNLMQYNKCLNQRNRLLHDIFFNPKLETELDIWDEQLRNYGSRLIEKRTEFTESLNETAGRIHQNLTGKSEILEVSYEKNTEISDFADKQNKNREADLKLKNTSAGPHRDDLCISVNGMDLRIYGSQGQQRTAALSLKLSEIQMIEKAANEKPVLLLDDVLSELDRDRQNYLLSSIKETQTFITCTGLDEFVKSSFNADRVFHVVKGGIE